MSDWRDLAACYGSDPEEWFPDTTPLPIVLDICNGCPVLTDCRAWVLDAEAGLGRDSRFGIFAAMTPKERWAADRCGRVPLIPGTACQERIGTDAGYQRHRRRREPPCDPCKAANAARRRRHRAAEQMAEVDA